MSKHYGVKCETCKEFVPLAEITQEDENDIAFYTVQTEPVVCTNGHSHLYGSKDRVAEEI